MRWVKIATVLWAFIGVAATLAFLVVYCRPLRRILEQFNCEDVERIRIGPIEIVKQCHSKRTRRRK
jgi:beta-lactamase regulating signal transducer with metallopeptidase domain